VRTKTVKIRCQMVRTTLYSAGSGFDSQCGNCCPGKCFRGFSECLQVNSVAVH